LYYIIIIIILMINMKLQPSISKGNITACSEQTEVLQLLFNVTSLYMGDAKSKIENMCKKCHKS